MQGFAVIKSAPHPLGRKAPFLIPTIQNRPIPPPFRAAFSFQSQNRPLIVQNRPLIVEPSPDCLRKR